MACCGKNSNANKKRIARTRFHVVTAGLDPAIHAEPTPVKIDRIVIVVLASAWTTGSGPVVTKNGAG
jgi:hypothetical protein